METSPQSTSSSKPPTTRSCRRCAVRKVKCDKQQPCSACIKQNATCEHPNLPPPRRRKKADQSEILRAQLNKRERELRQAGIDLGAITETTIQNASFPTSKEIGPQHSGVSSLQASKSVHSPPPGSNLQTQLLHHQNRSKYLENSLWTRVVEELAEPREALGYSSDEDDDGNETTEESINFLFGRIPTPVSIIGSHPPGDQIIELWEIYLENFDPLTKIVHGPSLRPVIRKAIVDLSSISKNLEVLLFAIYGAAVVTLKNHECERRFGDSRKVLLSRYRSATQTALSRANLTGSASLEVLQAFLIHLLSMRGIYDSRTVWVHAGLALRIAEGMGLHRDGSFLGLPPFETEIRRRIWWQLRLLDGDSAELSGSDKIKDVNSDTRSPKPPTNINDDQLYPSMSSIPAAVDGATDMIFCALRVEMRTYWSKDSIERRQQGESDPLSSNSRLEADLKERDKAIDGFESALETRFVRYCDPSQPIQLMATLLARCAVTVMRLMAYHPRRWSNDHQIPDSDRQYVWDLSVKSLKQYNMMDSSRELERFSWHSTFHFRWHPFIHILDTLRIHPLAQEAAQVWQMIDQVFETNPDFVTNRKKALYIAVGNLCLKAYASREAALTKEGKPIPTPPWYIKELHRQRDLANARRNNGERNMKNAENSFEETRPMAQPPQALPRQQSETVRSEIPLDFSAAKISSGTAEESSGYFTITDASNVDIDMLQGLDGSLEDPMNQTIDWVMWDSLLGDFS